MSAPSLLTHQLRSESTKIGIMDFLVRDFVQHPQYIDRFPGLIVEIRRTLQGTTRQITEIQANC